MLVRGLFNVYIGQHAVNPSRQAHIWKISILLMKMNLFILSCLIVCTEVWHGINNSNYQSFVQF